MSTGEDNTRIVRGIWHKRWNILSKFLTYMLYPLV